MATAKKLPSGMYRVRISLPGRHTKSFTAPTKREAERMALMYQAENHTTMTFGEALDRYIDSRSHSISASTLREYRRSAVKDYNSIRDIPLEKITQEQVQRLIDEKAADHSPKTVKNIHGLISAVLKTYRPDFRLHTRLPQKIEPDMYIPTDEDVKSVLKASESDPAMHLAILLAAFGPMRRSEICALQPKDIDGNIVHVHHAMVEGPDGWVIKQPKSNAGDRYIPLPDAVIPELAYLNQLNPNEITNRFKWILKHAGVQHFRFHALRHYCASRLHALGMPDAYIQQRGGWESDTVLKQIYRHALSDRAEEENKKANAIFDSIIES